MLITTNKQQLGLSVCIENLDNFCSRYLRRKLELYSIPTLSNSDTFQSWNFLILCTFWFWHYPILTLSDSDTFQSSVYLVHSHSCHNHWREARENWKYRFHTGPHASFFTLDMLMVIYILFWSDSVILPKIKLYYNFPFWENEKIWK